MKMKKKATQNQKSIIERKLRPWRKLRAEKTPPSGWVKAIRGALGINSRQLARLLDVDHSAILRMESREKQRKVTLELLDKAADAMGCKLVYALVPKENYDSLEGIIDEKAQTVAKEIVQKVEHSMRLEAQGQKDRYLKKRVNEIAGDLKSQMDSRLWDMAKRKKRG